jgi:hypothetical protein
MWDKSNDTGADLVRHTRKMNCVWTFSCKSHEYQHDCNEEEKNFSKKWKDWPPL